MSSNRHVVIFLLMAVATTNAASTTNATWGDTPADGSGNNQLAVVPVRKDFIPAEHGRKMANHNVLKMDILNMAGNGHAIRDPSFFRFYMEEVPGNRMGERLQQLIETIGFVEVLKIAANAPTAQMFNFGWRHELFHIKNQIRDYASSKKPKATEEPYQTLENLTLDVLKIQLMGVFESNCDVRQSSETGKFSSRGDLLSMDACSRFIVSSSSTGVLTARQDIYDRGSSWGEYDYEVNKRYQVSIGPQPIVFENQVKNLTSISNTK